MPRPTEKALKRKPRAVINLGWLKDHLAEDPDHAPEDFDFEWFSTEEGQEEFFDYSVGFNGDDWKNHGDVTMLVAEVTDTEKMTLGRVSVIPHTAAMNAWKKKVQDDPRLLIYPEPKKGEGEEAPKATRGRRPSAAAQAAKGGKDAPAKKAAESESKPRQVRKPAAAKKTAPTKKKSASPDAKKAALKGRLAAKKTADKPAAEEAEAKS